MKKRVFESLHSKGTKRGLYTAPRAEVCAPTNCRLLVNLSIEGELEDFEDVNDPAYYN